MRSLVVVDAEGFSLNSDAELAGLHAEIRAVLDRACEASGLSEVWRGAHFQQSTGDGVLAALPFEAMPSLVHPFGDRLQEVLADIAPGLRSRGLRLRLRVALHFGIVDDEDPVTAGISTATVDVNRLLDSEPARAALKESDPEVTHVAVILSAEVFETFVRGGRTKLQPSRMRPVRAQVKQFDRPAYLYVPAPSWTPRTGPDEGTEPRGGRVSEGGVSVGDVRISGNGQNAVGNQVGGDFRQER